ncbi:MAG: hypothetical protein SF187_17815 [Deltaproteobacteria bacterium]|nr:hypothetical protein [Deltaproteobacteria bacterium]
MKKLNNIRKAWTGLGGFCLLLVALAPFAWGGEADDLQAMIDRARRNVSDLQRIDEQRVAAEEIAVLSTWLDEAWRLRSEKQYDTVRQVLDRCDAQADMIREQITAGQLTAAAQKEEALLEASRKHVEELKQAIAAARQKKAQLEVMSK